MQAELWQSPQYPAKIFVKPMTRIEYHTFRGEITMVFLLSSIPRGNAS